LISLADIIEAPHLDGSEGNLFVGQPGQHDYRHPPASQEPFFQRLQFGGQGEIQVQEYDIDHLTLEDLPAISN